MTTREGLCDLCESFCPDELSTIKDFHGTTTSLCEHCMKQRECCFLCGLRLPARYMASFPRLSVCFRCARFHKKIPQNARTWLMRPLLDRAHDVYYTRVSDGTSEDYFSSDPAVTIRKDGKTQTLPLAFVARDELRALRRSLQQNERRRIHRLRKEKALKKAGFETSE